ncbi:MAG: hypothetical protein ACOYL9_12495 [Ilumatobacteraceae bacterium]
MAFTAEPVQGLTASVMPAPSAAMVVSVQPDTVVSTAVGSLPALSLLPHAANTLADAIATAARMTVARLVLM